MFDFDIGVRLRRPPEVFTRLEFVFDHKNGDWLFRLAQKEFWTVRDHFGEITIVTFTYPLGPRYTFRSLTAGKWSQKSNGLECEQTFGFIIQFAAKRRQLDLSASAFSEQSDLVNYRLSVGWRSKWLRPWNTVYITPELQFPVSEDLRARPAVRAGFEVAF